MSTDHTPDRTFRELSPLPADNLQDSAALLFAEVEIVSALPDEEVMIDVEAILWCSACSGPLREDLIEAGEELCDSCFEEASYER